MSLPCFQLRELVLHPVLEDMETKVGIPYSKVAEDLLIATAAQESQMGNYIAQIEGPALGIFQMEPRTANDIRFNYMQGDWRKWALVVDKWSIPNGLLDARVEQIAYNLAWATVLARVQYYRSPRALPPTNDPQDMWEMYKLVWNTPRGAATEAEFYAAWNEYTDLPKATLATTGLV